MTPTASFVDLLQSALTEPGIVSSAYIAFHGCSLCNQLLGILQCAKAGRREAGGAVMRAAIYARVSTVSSEHP